MDPSSYTWHASPTWPTVSTRRALASEALWMHRPPSARQLFLAGTLTFFNTPPPTLPAFRASVRRAWSRLRCENPILAARARVDADGGAWLECEALDGRRLREWVGRTVIVEEGTWKGWESSREEWREGGEHSARLRLGALEGGRVEFLFNFDHVITDGIGARILAGRWLHVLAAELGGVAVGTGESQGECEAQSLPPPPWMDVMNEHQITEGCEFEAAVRRQWEFLVNDCATNQHGFQPLPHSPRADTQTQHKAHFSSFSLEESISLLQCVKLELGCNATITHLGHAAMVLAMLQLEERLRVAPDLQASRRSKFTTFFSPCWMNGRRYLDPDRLSGNAYMSVCQALGEVVFPEIEQYSISRSTLDIERRKMLICAGKVAGASYRKIQERKSILSESVPLMQKLAQEKTHRDYETTFISAGIFPPFFLSDGITEQYIMREYNATSGANSRPVFSVDHVRFAANVEGPNIIVRMSSWRDVITLSAEWRSEQYAKELLKTFLDEITDLMLLITNKELG